MVRRTLTACAVAMATAASLTATALNAAAAQAAEPTVALNSIGRAIAVALASPAERTWLKSQLDGSKYVEYRVPFKDLLNHERTSAPMRSIVDGARFGPAIAGTVAGLPNLELYLPIEKQRASWRGGAGVDVAVRQPGGSYLIFSADGSSRAVAWNYDPGTRVTLVLARSEIDYADTDAAVRGGARTGDAMRVAGTVHPDAICTPETCPPGGGGGPSPPPPPPPTGGITSSHTAIDTLILTDDHEGAFGGLNEIEIFGNINGFYKDCGRVTNVHYGFAYSYTYPPGTHRTTLARAVPDDTHTFKLHAYEDDDGGCVHDGSDDNLGSWPTGLSLSQYGQAWYTENPSHLLLKVRAVTPFE